MPEGAAYTRRQFLQLSGATLAFALLAGCGSREVPVAGKGKPFPELKLPDLTGRETPLPRGPALIVNFWATWCSPCREEMPSLQRLASSYPPGDLQVIGISVDDDVNLVKEFQLRHAIDFTLLSDHDQRLTNTLQIGVLPMTFLLTREHVVADVVAGARDWAGTTMRKEIDRLLEVQAGSG